MQRITSVSLQRRCSCTVIARDLVNLCFIYYVRLQSILISFAAALSLGIPVWTTSTTPNSRMRLYDKDQRPSNYPIKTKADGGKGLAGDIASLYLDLFQGPL